MNPGKIFLVIMIVPMIVPVMVTARESKVALGGSISPGICSITSEAGITHRYIFKTHFRAGLDISFLLSRKSALSTGLHYSSIRYKAEYNYTINDSGDSSIPQGADISAGYLDIPITYNFNFRSKKKLGMLLSAGIISSLLISSDDKTSFEDHTIRDSGSLNSFLFSLKTGIGLRYSLKERLGIKLEPWYQIFMKGFDTTMNRHPAAINLTIAIIYDL
jgi:hypothetical protein